MNTNHSTRLGDPHQAGAGRARRLAVALIAASALAGTAAGLAPRAVIAAGAGTSAPPPLASLLPSLPSVPVTGGDGTGGGSAAQPHPVPFCEQASLDCVATSVERLRALRDRLGCDHRAIFASTYMEGTQKLLEAMRGDPHFFQDPVWFTYVDVHFINVYLQQVEDYDAGRPVSEAWRVAFDTARSGEVYAGQDLLLALNAHIQSDLPFVEAEMGLRTPAGETRKPDHLRIGELLQSDYPRIVQGIAQRYDPMVAITNPGLAYDSDAAHMVFTRWREDAWRNAERLTSARTPAERDSVAASITASAATWARSMAATQVPGYRSQRDAYCQSHASGA
jgi:hypothetical protein